MERLISDEERIRRAEDIIERRRNADFRIPGENFSKDKSQNKVKKILIQIIICLIVYCGIYYVKNSPDDNSQKFVSDVNNFLQQDIDFYELYSFIIDKYNSFFYNTQENVPNEEDGNAYTENGQENSGAETIENNGSSENSSDEITENNNSTEDLGIGGSLEDSDEVATSDELVSDAEYIKENYNIINPLPTGIITSKFGTRASNEIVSANHKGIDLGASVGTDIISCMDGEVIEASSQGDFGVHLKISNNDIVVTYAHCSELLVNEGEKVSQGSVIAKVGATGKATGPHLHFEIRRDDRAVNPEDILQF